MRRKIDSVLDNWLLNRKQAILLFGARQTGKTYAIRSCFNRNSCHFVEINFALDKVALELFSKLTSVNDFYVKLSLVANGELVTNKTCVFLDEIQSIYLYRESLRNTDPNLFHTTIDPISLIKKLVEDGRFRYALSGSLLGINLVGISSNPVGYLDTFTLYPLDFEEFLWANNIGEEVIEYLKTQFKSLKPVDDMIHQKIINTFYEYLLVGGMPEATNEYISSHDLNRVRNAQKQILNGYKNDIQKYAPIEHRVLIGETFNRLPGELNRKDKHFRKSKLDYPNSKNIDLTDIYLWLTNAGVALATYNVNEPTYPLKLNEHRKVLKLFSNDIGLLSSQLFENEGAIKVLQDDSSINFGSLFENVVAQELSCKGYSTYYFNSKKIGEVDFLIEKEGNVVPLEIKTGSSSGVGFFEHKALNSVIDVYKDIKKAYVLSKNNISIETDKIINLPIYMVMFFKPLN